jgi:hypothetical protein
MLGFRTKSGEFCVQWADLVARFVALLDDSVELHSKRFRSRLALLPAARSDQPANETADTQRHQRNDNQASVHQPLQNARNEM